MAADWLVAVAWVALAVAFACAAAIAYDVYGRGYRQRMKVMEIVWPVTALYAGPSANLAYERFGKPKSHRWMVERGRDEPPDKPWWATVSVGVSHCGAGCTLGDIIAEAAVFLLALSIAGQTLFAEYVGDYVLAVGLGLAFQYFAIAPRRGLGFRKGIAAAAKADILSLTAFEVGLFGWMALTSLVFFPAPHHLQADSPVYWFMMQIGMCLGFLTAYPVNAWLIRRGIKEAM
ncbi:MAG: DUF4396 domain-containing protein [Nocardioides sp.]